MENQIVLKKTQNELSFKLRVQARAYNLRISSKKLIKLLCLVMDSLMFLKDITAKKVEIAFLSTI